MTTESFKADNEPLRKRQIQTVRIGLAIATLLTADAVVVAGHLVAPNPLEICVDALREEYKVTDHQDGPLKLTDEGKACAQADNDPTRARYFYQPSLEFDGEIGPNQLIPEQDTDESRLWEV